ncbi:transposase, partial [Rhodococcus ruber BKS 20-38]
TVLHRSAAMPVTRACALVGVPRSSYYRLSRGYTHYRPVQDPVPQARRRQPAALSGAERAAIVEVLSAADHADLSVVQTYWRVFDAGTVACSQ